MKRFTSVVSCVFAFLLCVGCIDLTVPEPARRAAVTGRVDVQQRVSKEGHQVALVSESGTRLSQPTNAEGAFTFDDLAPGLYYLELKIPGFAPLIRPSVRALAGQTVDVGVLEPVWLQSTPQAGTLIGLVSIEGGAGNPAGGQVEIVLEGVNQNVALAALSASGRFVEKVPPGTYTLKATHPLFVTQTKTGVVVAEAATVDLTAQPLVLQLNPATITGAVLKEVDGREPVAAAGALITVVESGATTTTDMMGQYRLTGLGPGTTTTRVTLTDFHDTPREAVRLSPGQALALPTVTLALNRGDLTGEVTTGDGQPIDGAVVSVVGTSYGAQVVGDVAMPSRGTFLIRGLPVGSYSVRVTKPRYVAATSSQVMVTANVATRLSTPLQLALQQGDFLIDDQDPTSASGYTRTRTVTLTFNFSQAVRYRASEDASFAGVMFAPFTGPMQSFTLSNSQGTHVVYAQFEDASSNVSPTFSASIVLDSVAPSSPSLLINGGDAFTRQANPLALTLTAIEVPGPSTDTVSGLGAVRLSETPPDGGVLTSAARIYSREMPLVPASLADGPKTVYAQFLDNAGNASAIVSASIVVDSQAPAMTVLSIARGTRASIDGYTDSALIQLSLDAAAEPNAGFVTVRIANSTTALARSPFSPLSQTVAWFLDPTTQGNKTVYAEFRDAAGNVATVQSASIVYDTQPPAPVTLTVSGPAITNATLLSLTASATDTNGLAANGFAVSEDPSFQSFAVGPRALPMGAFSVAPSAGDGLKRLFARFRDVAGNESIAQATVTIDTTGPEGQVELTGTLADGTSSSTLTATANVTAALTARGAQGYLLGNDSIASCPSAAASYAPIPAVVSALPVSLSAGQGAKQARLCLIDAAGNVTGPFSDSLIVDSVPPTACTLSAVGTLADGMTPAPSGQTARSIVNATVQGCSSDTREFVLAGDTVTCSASMVASWQSFVGPSVSQAVLLGRGDGPNTVAGCYRDAARNVATLTPASLALDTTPPAALGLVLNGGAPYLGLAQLDGGQPVVQVTGSAVGATQWALSETNPTAFGAFTGNTFMQLGGSGPRVVYGRFRDDLGNLSGVVSASITVDTQPPSTTGAAFRIDTPDGGSFVNSQSVTLVMAPPGDGISQQLTERSPVSPCAAGDFISASSTPSATSAVFTLSPGEGAHRVCIRWLDAAGNPSAPLGDTKTLDTTPPNQPVMLSFDRVFNPNVTGETTASWVSIVNAVDSQTAGFQVLGGLTSVWTTATTQAPGPGTPGCTSGLCVRVPLRISPTAESGTPNVVRVREVDQAGNASGEASISLTTDVVVPRPVALKATWVDNRSGAASVHWLPLDGGSPDTVAHYVYYDSVPANPGDGGLAPPTGYAGTSASQGPSPVQVESDNKAVLSGLINGTTSFVTVRAVDRAGNLSPTALDTPEVVLQPNELSPNVLSSQSILADAGVNFYGQYVEVVGHTAYVYASSVGVNSAILPVDLSNIASPLQGGTVGVGSAPQPYAPVLFSDGPSVIARPGAMVAEPPYLFTASGHFFRVWSILNETAPTLLYTVDVGAGHSLNALEVRGPHAFATSSLTTTWLFHINLSNLYDNNAATGISAANLVTALDTGVAGGSNALLWTRDRLIAAGTAFPAQGFNLVNALSFLPTTLGQRFTQGFLWAPTDGIRLQTSGNLVALPDSVTMRFVNIAPFWSDALPTGDLSQVPIAPTGQFVQVADQLMYGDGTFGGVQVASVSSIASPRSVGVVRPLESAGRPGGLALYGSYLLQATEQSFPLGSRLRVYELATPESMRLELSDAVIAKRPLLGAGFVFGASGLSKDMFNGGNNRIVATAGDCVYDGVMFDDTIISTRANPMIFNDFDMRIIRTDEYSGRVFAPPSITANSVSFKPTTARWTGIERYGNYIIVTAARPTGTTPQTGLWIEVYRANGLRSRATGGARSLIAGDKVTEFQYDTSTINYTVFTTRLRVSGPYAVITTTNLSGLAAPYAYLLDLRPMLDDNAATNMSAANVLGRIATPTGDMFTTVARDGVLKGNMLYFAVNSSQREVGLWVVDATDGLDGNAATVLDGNDVIARVTQTSADSIDVAGAYAVVTGNGTLTTNSISTYDISSPAQPRLVAQYPYMRPGGVILSCGTDLHTSTRIIGNRVYVGASERLDIVNLE